MHMTEEEDRESEDEVDDDSSTATSMSDDDEISFDDFDLGIQQRPFMKWGSEAFVSVPIKRRAAESSRNNLKHTKEEDDSNSSHKAEKSVDATFELKEAQVDDHYVQAVSDHEHAASESESASAESIDDDDDDDDSDEDVFLYRGQYDCGKHEYEARLDPHVVTKVKVLKSVGNEIPNRAFQYCSLLVQAKLPRRGLVKIGIGAFEDCSQLQEIDIPSSVVEIKTNAFWSCRSLRHLMLPEGLQIVGVGAFAYCEFETVVYPSSLKEIRDGAFHWNSGLTTVYLKEGLEVIGKDAFRYASGPIHSFI